MEKLYNLKVRSRNKSCAPLKELKFPKVVIYRMGSTTPTEKITKKKDIIEINTPLTCKMSNDKEHMRWVLDNIDQKNYYGENEYVYIPKYRFVQPSSYFTDNAVDEKDFLRRFFGKNKVIMKDRYSSGGKGIWLFDNVDMLFQSWDWSDDKHYVLEEYLPYVREYRIHIAKGFGCFYATRKLLKTDAKERWHRHHNNCIFVGEDNPLFDKPSNWDEIIEVCKDAAYYFDAADLICFDVKVQSSKYKNPKFAILESNTAPGLGEVGIQKYKEIITRIVESRI